MKQSDTPRTDLAAATGYFDKSLKWVTLGSNDQVPTALARDLERELTTATRERDEWQLAAQTEAKMTDLVARERDEARAEVERLRSEIERAAIACSHGESQMARTILLAATEAP